MNKTQSAKSKKAAMPKKRKRRWLRRIAIVFALLIITYLLFRLFYPAWINMRLPADAPRIAFSLDNTLIGRIGVTDATYQRAMFKAGGRLITLRPDAAGDPEVSPDAVKALLNEKEIDGLLLAGGGDVDPKLYGGDPNKTMLVHRLRDDFEIALIHAAKKQGLPILGICRGCQILNVALGGTIRNLRREDNVKGRHLSLKRHAVELTPKTNLAELLGVTRLSKVISLHGQAVDTPGRGVKIAATGPGEVVEAVETQKGWILGIQWHPELTLNDKVQHRIFEAFVDRTRKARNLKN
ncbi:MAG: gamma-glutamyl-gamma-aminobutyrate hydrolase family protein [Planctomycetota bacterium]|jgi:putative glutamine amidotransferase